MRTHGWDGSPPSTDEEAITRILDAAQRGLDRSGRDLSLADVARELGVIRQTVYRYFGSTEELIVATAIRAAVPFLGQLKAHLDGITDPALAVVRSMSFVIEHLPENQYLDIALRPTPAHVRAEQVTSSTAREFGAALLLSLDVDWAGSGFDDGRMAELVEHMLRITQSILIDPGDPPRSGAELERYLETWLAPAINAIAVQEG